MQCRQIHLEPPVREEDTDTTELPGVFLCREPGRKAAACKVNFSATWVNQEMSGHDYTEGEPPDTFHAFPARAQNGITHNILIVGSSCRQDEATVSM